MPGWYGNAWQYRKSITVNNTANTTSALAYYQAAVKLTGSDYTSFAAHAKADGSDLRVTDADGVTPLSFALEGIDTANSAVYLMVKVPFVAAAATRTIYIYYGNAAAASTSSYANTVGPTTTAIGPTNVMTQAMHAGPNGMPYVIRLQHQDGANGGGASLNGTLICYEFLGGLNFADPSNSDIGYQTSNDSGVTWSTPTLIGIHGDSTHCFYLRSASELSDGTILICYQYDLNTLQADGKGKQYIGKSTDGGATYTNVSTTPANQMSVPWTYGTDIGVAYSAFLEKTPGGDLYLPLYGKIATDTGWHAWLAKCPSGSDPTNGSNWVIQGTMAFNNVDAFTEPTVLQTSDSSHYICAMRCATQPGLMFCSSTDSGVTWGTPTVMGMPGTASNDQCVSPWFLRLASGNILLSWGIRYGTLGGFGAVVSTDGGTTWLDRAPAIASDGQGNPSQSGYPTVCQLANGKLVFMYMNEVGGSVDTTDVACFICTEDYIVNSPNVYESCESLAGFRLAGANATVSTTHVHNGTKAIKIDNSAATGGINDYVVKDMWSTNPAQQGPKVAISWWSYETANDSSRVLAIKDSQSPAYNVATGQRTNIYVLGTTSDHVSWYNGTAQQDTGVACPANQWAKLGMRASMQPTSVTGEIRLNNTSLTTGLGQSGNGGNPQQILVQGGSTGSTHNVIFWLDDIYTHQYTANIPSTSVGAEQTNLGSGAAVFSI